MTDLLDRDALGIRAEDPGPSTRERHGSVGVALDETTRWLLAAPLAGAGVVHLVMTPSHLGESAVEGIGFVLAGWLQVALALILVAVVRPRRWVIALAGASSAALIGAWIVSRVFGLPFGAHAGHPASVSIVDASAVLFEAVVLLVAAMALAGRARPRRRRGDRLRLLVPLAVAALTTVAIASPSARDHASAGHGDRIAAAHDHEEDDLGFSLLGNGHQHDDAEWVDLDPATQAELDAQLATTEALIEMYPTVADAEAAGYRRAGPFAPGLGTHFSGGAFGINLDGVMSPEDIMRPVLIYDGHEPASPLAGFMYLVMGEDEPEGFAGPNDHWHYHTNVCIVVSPSGEIDTPFGADLPGVTEEMCQAVGGSFIELTGWMVHVWTVPGYESELGVFSELNPALTCPDGTYHMIPIDELGTGDTTCRSD